MCIGLLDGAEMRTDRLKAEKRMLGERVWRF